MKIACENIYIYKDQQVEKQGKQVGFLKEYISLLPFL